MKFRTLVNVVWRATPYVATLLLFIAVSPLRSALLRNQLGRTIVVLALVRVVIWACECQCFDLPQRRIQNLDFASVMIFVCGCSWLYSLSSGQDPLLWPLISATILTVLGALAKKTRLGIIVEIVEQDDARDRQVISVKLLKHRRKFRFTNFRGSVWQLLEEPVAARVGKCPPPIELESGDRRIAKGASEVIEVTVWASAISSALNDSLVLIERRLFSTHLFVIAKQSQACVHAEARGN